MEIETDCEDLDVSDQVCSKCGAKFANVGERSYRNCPACRERKKEYRKTHPVYHDSDTMRERKRCEELHRQKLAERQRLRDEAYERWKRRNGVEDKVTVSPDGLVTVTRGICPLGVKAISFVKHN